MPFKIARPVRCKDTGKEWRTLKACATELGKSPSCVREHIRFGEALDGKFYEYI